MFTVNEFKIVFKRRWHDKRRPLSKALRESETVKMPDTNGRYDTVCEIYVKDLEVPRFTGVAKLHPNDKPDKIVGKKIALRNALGSRKFSGDPEPAYNCAEFYYKAVRSAIWAAFSNWVSQWPHQVAPKPIVQKPR